MVSNFPLSAPNRFIASYCALLGSGLNRNRSLNRSSSRTDVFFFLKCIFCFFLASWSRWNDKTFFPVWAVALAVLSPSELRVSRRVSVIAIYNVDDVSSRIRSPNGREGSASFVARAVEIARVHRREIECFERRIGRGFPRGISRWVVVPARFTSSPHRFARAPLLPLLVATGRRLIARPRREHRDAALSTLCKPGCWKIGPARPARRAHQGSPFRTPPRRPRGRRTTRFRSAVTDTLPRSQPAIRYVFDLSLQFVYSFCDLSINAQNFLVIQGISVGLFLDLSLKCVNIFR